MPTGHSVQVLATALLGALAVAAQDLVASQWCDEETDICFQRYYDAGVDMSWGYLFPPAQPRVNEFIGIFTGPIESGWIGNSLGGDMRSNPLVVGWLDSDSKAMVSIRFTDQLLSPDVLEGPELTILGTSGSNGTHQRIVYRCQNCTEWTGGTNGIPSNGTAPFGYAASSEKPPDISNSDSTVPQHSIAGVHELDVSASRSPSYNASLDLLVGAPPLTPPEGTPSSTTSQAPPTSTGPVSCPNAPAPRYPLKVAQGWGATPVLGGLSTPRGIAIDSEGHLLVVERGIGITGHTLDSNGCVTNSSVVVADGRLNHGIDVLGNRLVASSSDVAWSWEYDAKDMSATGRKALVTDMDHPGHVTRTLLISRKNPDYLVVSVGSNGNIEEASIRESSGTAQIRVFNMRTLPGEGASFTDETHGKIMGYGLRNDVGMTEDRAGIVHSIENSADNAFRIVNGNERDIHTNNPAEKVYNLGSVTSPSGLFGGYPVCLTVWDGGDFGKEGDVSKKPGDWFVQDTTNTTFTDAWCETNATKPTVLLPPHTAPLDMKFGVRDGDANMYASLHGSWNRDVPIGYKVVAVPGRFSSSGEWSPRDSLERTKGSITDVLSNRDETQCQRGCFRPVGLAFDETGERLYVSSDTSGEIFLVKPGENANSSSRVQAGSMAITALLPLFLTVVLL